MHPGMPPQDSPAAAAAAADLLVRFWGVRGSVAVPGPHTVRYGGNTSCVEVRYGHDIVILDAGTGLRELGRKLVRELARHPARLRLLITHTHWDHIQGLPFFAPAYVDRQPIEILGPPRSRAGFLRTVAAAVESPFFPVALRDMPGNITFRELGSDPFSLGALACRTAPLNHPGGGFAFRLDSPAGSVAYVPDHEIPCPLAEARRLPRAIRQRDAALRELIRDVDLLIHDAQYTSAEYATRVGWGHSCYEAAVLAAVEARARRLLLFHHDPDRTDRQMESLIRKARRVATRAGSSLVVEAAREGLTIVLRRQASSTATAAA
jgi:phosphoribosyl 1,2-cyclic phosphodiesterase